MDWKKLLKVAVKAAIAPAPPARKKSPAPTLRQVGKSFREIVGESFYRQALSEIAGGKALPELGKEVVATLVCENGNPHDSNAVMVTINDRTVGYLTREDAVQYRKQLRKEGFGEAPQRVAGRIAGGGRGKNYGVWIDLPDRIV